MAALNPQAMVVLAVFAVLLSLCIVAAHMRQRSAPRRREAPTALGRGVGLYVNGRRLTGATVHTLRADQEHIHVEAVLPRATGQDVEEMLGRVLENEVDCAIRIHGVTYRFRGRISLRVDSDEAVIKADGGRPDRIASV